MDEPGSTAPLTAAARRRPQIREVTDLDTDWPKLWSLLRLLDEHHARITGRTVAPDREPRQRRRIERMLSRDRGMVLLAELDGEPVASGLGYIQRNPSIFEEKLGLVNDFYVRPDLRGSPLVRQMHRRIEAWLLSRGVKEVQRTTLVANERTLRLWQHMGYRPFMQILRKQL